MGNDYHEQKKEFIEEKTKRREKYKAKVKSEFKSYCLENYPYFNENHSPYEMALFLAIILGVRREDLQPKIEDLTLYDIRFVYSKAGINLHKEYKHIMDEAERFGYDSVFDMLSSNYKYEDRQQLAEEIDVSIQTVLRYARKCVEIIRRVWYNYSWDKIDKLWNGESNNE